jgi:glycosyltransferase involved in cell wall biosynthesis
VNDPISNPLDATELPRLAILVTHPIQHFCPMYRSIAADGRVKLLVIFTHSGAGPRFDSGFGRVVEWQSDILEGYRSSVISASESERMTAVLRELSGFAPDVVYVHGYHLLVYRAVMKWANRSSIPVLMTTDSELRHPRPWPVRIAKRLTLPKLFRRVGLFLTVGDENEKYFGHYGVPTSHFHRVPFSIDSAFYDKVLSRREETRERLRLQLGIPSGAVVILTAGKLIQRKRQEDLIRAFESVPGSRDGSAVLLIAGDGSLRAHLEEVARPLGAAVKLLGFVDISSLPEHYIAADIYVHPSDHDPHPLAISEALYCGLPVIVSDRIGSAGPTDDVRVGENGWEYPVGDVARLSCLLNLLIDDAELRTRAGLLSRRLGKLHSADRCAARFVDGALLALKKQEGGE